VNVFGDLQLDKAEEALVFRPEFVIVSDDSAFLADIRESGAEDRAHLSKKMAKLIQDDTKVIDWDLILLFETSVDVPEMLLDVLQIELFLLHECISI
jgi:hypothetical protein